MQADNNVYNNSEKAKLHYIIGAESFKKNQMAMFKKNIIAIVGILFILFNILISLFSNIGTAKIIFFISMSILVLIVIIAMWQNRRNVPSEFTLTDLGFTNKTPVYQKSYKWEDFIGYRIKSSKVDIGEEYTDSIGSYRATYGEVYYLYHKKKQFLPTVYLPALPENSEEVRKFLDQHLTLLN